MLIKIINSDSVTNIQSSIMNISQNGDNITILANHENIIYSIRNGVISFEDGSKIDVSLGLVKVFNGECSVVI